MPYKNEYTERYQGDYGEARLSPKLVNTELGKKLRPPHTPTPSVRETTGGRGAMWEQEAARRERTLLPGEFFKGR